LLAVSGGKERIMHYWREVDENFVVNNDKMQLIHHIHSLKTKAYENLVQSGALPLRSGILRIIREAQANRLALAIATTTTPANIDVLLRPHLGADWKKLFCFVGDAETAPFKKPNPQVYLQTLDALGLEPTQCLAFEDSYNGLTAALSAGIPTLITPTAFTAEQDFSGAVEVVSHLGEFGQALPERIRRESRDAIDVIDLPVLQFWHKRHIVNFF
jgi:beta-phosphoglucomutase-like phosphatase (HAD superfamily)